MNFLKSVTTFINFNIAQRFFPLGYKDEFKVLILSALPIVKILNLMLNQKLIFNFYCIRF
jgi:hypothetical protein